MSDPVHVRQAMARILYESTDLSRSVIDVMVENLIAAMVTPRETVRSGREAISRVSLWEKERLLRVIASLEQDANSSTA